MRNNLDLRTFLVSLDRANVLRLASVALVSAGLVYLSHAFTREAGRVASIWPLNAFVLAVLLRHPPTGWVQFLVAAFGANAAVNLAMQDTPLDAVLLSLINAGETYLCARLLYRREAPFDITQSRHLWRFLLVAGTAVPALSAVLASVVLAGKQPIEVTIPAWYMADALGMLVFAPALLVFGASPPNTNARPSLLAAVTALLILLVTLLIVFGQDRYPLLFLVPSVLALATFKLGMRGAAIGILITAFVAIGSTVAGLGPAILVQGTDADRVNLLQAFLAFITLTTLPIAAALAERTRIRNALEVAGKQAEAATSRAQQSEHHYRTLAQHSTDIVVRFSKGGVISYASPASSLLGITPEQAVGRTTIDFAAPESKAHARLLVEALFSGAEPDRSVQREFRVAHADGSVMWLEGSPNIIRDESGAPVEVVSTYRDVTARRALEDELKHARLAAEELAAAARASELRYRMMAESSSDVITRVGVNGDWTFVSPRSHEVLGYAAEEMIGTKWYAYTHPDHVQAVTDFFADLVKQGPNAPMQSFQYRGLHKNGGHVWLECNPRVIFDAAGKLVEIQDSVRDITRRKELEEELIAAQQEALAAVAAKADFVANMSHELRTPLNSIIGFARLLAASAKISDADKRYSEIISTSSEGLLHLVNDVLDFSSLEAGQTSLERRAFSFDDMLRRCLDTLQLEADRRVLLLAVETDGGLASLHYGDEIRISQVVLNLASNALKFTERGSVTVRVKSTTPKDGWQSLLIEVVDTGIGISPDKLPILFERFAQVDSSINRRYGGTGLGLAISRHFVELMGGRIGVRSSEGAGSTFWFELKLEASAAEPPGTGRARASRALAGQAKRILVVDDVDLNRELIIAQLANTGHVVESAAGGEVAVEMVRKAHYDLVFMDVQMPGLDGRAATRAIRQIEGRQDMPVIALTAQALPAQIAASLAAGMNDHLGKPFRAESLLAMVAKWASQSGAADGQSNTVVIDDLRDRFLERAQDDYDKLQKLSMATGDATEEEAAFLIHRLAGTAGTFGFDEVGKIAGALDTTIGEGGRVAGADLDQLMAALKGLLVAAPGESHERERLARS